MSRFAVGVRRPVLVALPETGPSSGDETMKVAERKRAEEPVGIVIRGGTQPVQTSVFVAYEWSPPTSGEDEPKAA